MRVSFANRRLRRNYGNFASASRDWGATVARRYVERVETLRETEQFHLLYPIRRLRLHRLSGRRSGQFSIVLDRRWRLIITYLESEETIVIEEVTNHYDD